VACRLHLPARRAPLFSSSFFVLQRPRECCFLLAQAKKNFFFQNTQKNIKNVKSSSTKFDGIVYDKDG